MTPERAADLRLRAEQGDGNFCLHEHTLHQKGGSVWATCETPEGPVQVGRTRFNPDRDDNPERIQAWAQGVMGAHHRAAVSSVVLELLDYVTELEEQAHPKLYVSGFQPWMRTTQP